MKIANLFAIPACIGLCVLATPISQLIYATPNAGPVIAVISLSIIFLGWQQITAGILQGLGAHHYSYAVYFYRAYGESYLRLSIDRIH